MPSSLLPAPAVTRSSSADPRPLVYLAPSGVQKERILPEHMFVLPFAQSSVPKPGSQRDFVRVPNKKVRQDALELIGALASWVGSSGSG